jgi:hypothetical protein
MLVAAVDFARQPAFAGEDAIKLPTTISSWP